MLSAEELVEVFNFIPYQNLHHQIRYVNYFFSEFVPLVVNELYPRSYMNIWIRWSHEKKCHYMSVMSTAEFPEYLGFQCGLPQIAPPASIKHIERVHIQGPITNELIGFLKAIKSKVEKCKLDFESIEKFLLELNRSRIDCSEFFESFSNILKIYMDLLGLSDVWCSLAEQSGQYHNNMMNFKLLKFETKEFELRQDCHNFELIATDYVLKCPKLHIFRLNLDAELNLQSIAKWLFSAHEERRILQFLNFKSFDGVEKFCEFLKKEIIKRGDNSCNFEVELFPEQMFNTDELKQYSVPEKLSISTKYGNVSIIGGNNENKAEPQYIFDPFECCDIDIDEMDGDVTIFDLDINDGKPKKVKKTK